MTIKLKGPELRELKPRIMVCGIGGGGCNAVNNMIASGLSGVEFIVANTDAQALTTSRSDRIIQMGMQVTEGLGAGAQPEVGRAAAEEAIEEIRDHLTGAHMCFVTAGMGGGTGTGAAPVIARAARELGILTVGVVTKPFQFEGQRRMRTAEAGISELQKAVDTLIVIPNQNLFRVATERTTFADAFAMADQVLYSGVASITDLMVKQGLVNLDFADVRSIMRDMGKAMMGTGEASGEKRAILAAEAAIANPLLDEISMKGARGLLISITGGADMTLYEVDEAASRIRQEVDEDANIILGATFDESLDGVIRVSVVATGIDKPMAVPDYDVAEARIAEAAQRLRAQALQRGEQRPVDLPLSLSSGQNTAPGQNTVPGQNTAPGQNFVAGYAAPAPAPTPEHSEASEPESIHQDRTHAHRQTPHEDLETHDYQPIIDYGDAPEMEAHAERAQLHEEHHSYHETQNNQHPAATTAQVYAQDPPRGQRMPQIEDFPLPAQQQMRAVRSHASQDQHAGEQHRRSTLLERLAAFGGPKEELQKPQQAPRSVQAPQNTAMPQHAQGQPPVRPFTPPSGAHSEYAKRPAAPQRSPYDARPQQRSEEDQLEIPAFLRRQSS